MPVISLPSFGSKGLGSSCAKQLFGRHFEYSWGAMLSTLAKHSRRLTSQRIIPGMLKTRAFSSDAVEEELRKNLQLKCEQTCREIRRSHSLVDKEIASLGDLARAQEKCWVAVSFQAPVGQVKEANNRQKQIQEQELNQLKGYLTQKLDELSLKLTRKFALYERDIRRLKVENRTLKGQVKLWQSATLMIIALVGVGAGATIWSSSPNALPSTELDVANVSPLTELDALEDISSPNVLTQDSCLPMLDAAKFVDLDAGAELNGQQQTQSIVCLMSSWEAARDSSVVVPAVLSIVVGCRRIFKM